MIGHLVGGGSRSTLSMTKPTVNIEAPEVALQETLTAGDKSFHKTSRQDYPDPYSVPKPFNNLPTANVSAVPSTSRSLYTHSVSIPESIPLGGNIKTAIEAITDRVEHVQSELTAATAATAAIIDHTMVLVVAVVVVQALPQSDSLMTCPRLALVHGDPDVMIHQ